MTQQPAATAVARASDSLGAAYLADVVARFEALRSLAERAVEQVDDTGFFATLDGGGQGGENSIAILMKHMAGNLRSRFTDFLTSDGEKPDRDRDAEFEREAADSRDSIMARWAEGWSVLFDALRALHPGDLQRQVTIRGEPHAVLQAISRQLAHQAQHAGQIVLLARHHAGPAWRTLSVPRGQSSSYTESVRRAQAAKPHPGGDPDR